MRRNVFVFDLDGTLVDSVYQHVLAWQEAMEDAGIELSVWRIHRRRGMSGGLFVGALLRELGRPVEAELVARLQQAMPRPTGAGPGRCACCPAPASCSPA
jgi:beta-phosphoglucomutase-like phosphatase (HAD superfamily)